MPGWRERSPQLLPPPAVEEEEGRVCLGTRTEEEDTPTDTEIGTYSSDTKRQNHGDLSNVVDISVNTV